MLGNEAIHGLVRPLHEAVGTDGDDGVLHAVEQSFELALAGADGGEAAFDLSGSFVDGGGDAADLIERTVLDAGTEVALLDADGDIDDVLEASRGPDGSGGGDEQGEEQSDGRAPEQAAIDLRLNGFDIGKRIGEPDGATGDGDGHVEKWNAERGAAALVLADLSGEGGGEFLASGVILHVGGIGFGVGEDFAGGVDDSGASSGGECLPARRFR